MLDSAVFRNVALSTAALALAVSPHASAATGPAIHLVGPIIADAGRSASFSLRANHWPSLKGHALLQLRSKHHGFTGSMHWSAPCSCYRATVRLVARVHPLEAAQASALLVFPGGRVVARTSFQIRGLAPGRRRYAPGGRPYVSAWIANPVPHTGEVDPLCVWVHAADEIGLGGKRVSITAHFPTGKRRFVAFSNGDGIACRSTTVPTLPSRTRVAIDFYVGRLHRRVDLTTAR